MTTLQIAWIACLCVSAVLAAVFIVVREVAGKVKNGLYSFITKSVASASFVVTGIVLVSLKGTWGNAWSLCLVLGAFFGMVGDMLLDLKRSKPQFEDAFLNGGMLSFGVGHFLYFLAAMFFIAVVRSPLVPALVGLVGLLLAGGAILLSKLLKMNLGNHMLQAVAYLGILMYMAVLTLTASIQNAVLPVADSVPYMWLFTLGMWLFLGSDIMLSFTYFGNKENKPMMVSLSVSNHIFYYAAQLTLMSLLFFI